MQARLKILKRLLTRPEMEKAWGWMNTHHTSSLSIAANGGIIGRLLLAIHRWESSLRLSSSDRQEELKTVARLARRLSSKLRAMRGESWGFMQPITLVPKEYEEKLAKALHPDLVGRSYKKRPLRQWLTLLQPPIEDQLETLAVAASSIAPEFGLSDGFPRKITARSAFRTFIINSLTHDFHLLTGHHAPAMIATWASVALDDPNITSDTVRKCSAARKIAAMKLL
jgi:hypothetical protein